MFQSPVVCAAILSLHILHVTAVPSDCTPLEDTVLDTFDPLSVYQATHEIREHQPPRRVPNGFRDRRTIPTHHFVTSQLKERPEPMVLWPYMCKFDVISNTEGANL